MPFLSLVTRRLVAQRLLALALLITMAFTIGVLVAGPIYADGSARAIVTGTVAQSLIGQRNVRFSVVSNTGFDVDRADRDVRAAVSGLPVRSVAAQWITQTISAFNGGGVEWAEQLLYRDGAFDHLQIQGQAPTAPGEAVMFAGDAFAKGVQRGDVLRIEAGGGRATNVSITGLYTLPPTSDPEWFGAASPLVQTDTQAPHPRPLIMSRPGMSAALSALGLDTGQTYSWDAFTELRGLTLEQLRAATRGFEGLRTRLERRPGLTYMTEQSGLPEILAIASVRVGNARAPIYLVVFQIAAVALAVLAGVSSLALSRQSFELAVLKSRGFTHRQLLVAQGAESLLAAAGALPLGLVLGLLLARMARTAHGPLVTGTPFPIRLSGTAVAVGVLAALVGAALVLLTSVPHVLRTVLEERHRVSRESKPFLSRFPVEIVAGALGAVAFWEVKRRGLGPAARTGSIDPLVLLAPTLLLFAASFFSLRLLLWGFRRLDGVVGRARRLPLYLAGRRLGRGASASFATALLLLLATGLLVVSSSYRATILTSHSDVAHQEVGADWSVQTATVPQALAAMRRMPVGTTAMYAGQIDAIDVNRFAGGDIDVAAAGSHLATASILAVDPSTYPKAAWWRDDYSTKSLDSILDELRTSAPGIALPRGGTSLTVTASSDEASAGLDLVAAVLRRSGRVSMATVGVLRTDRVSASVPVASGDRLLAIDVVKAGQLYAPPSIRVTVAVRTETPSGPVSLPLTQWGPMEWLGSGGTARPEVDGGITAELRAGGGHAVAGLIPPQPVLPAVGTSDLAAIAGQEVHATICGTGLDVRIDDTVGRFPGTDPGATVMLVADQALFPRLERVPEWCGGMNLVRAAGGTDPGPTLRQAGVHPVETASAAAIEAALAQDPETLALGMHFAAAAGGMGLVIIGVAVSLYFGQRRRQFEFAALRAMGAERRQMLAALIGEQGFLTAFALAVSLALGYGLLRLIMPYAARGLSRASPPGLLLVDWPAVSVFVGAVVVMTALGVALGARALFARPVPAILRGEAE